MSLLDRTKGVPKEILRLIPIEEMRFIVSGRDNLVSDRTKNIIEDGRKQRSNFSEALDVLTSIGGGIAGGAAGGALAGPIGAVVGGVAGGAMGAFGGTLAEDVLDDRKLDAERAAIEAGKSIAFDAGTLFVFGAAKRIGKLFNIGAKTVIETKPTKNILEDIDTVDLAETVSTPQSRRMTQAILEEGANVSKQGQEATRITSSLNVQQTQNASRIKNVAQDIVDLGILSGTQSEKTAIASGDIIKQRLKNLAGGQETPPEKGQLGLEMFNIIQGAKLGLINNYSKRKQEIVNSLPKNFLVDSNKIIDYMDSKLAQGSTVKIIGQNEPVAVLDEVKTIIRKVRSGIPDKQKLPLTKIVQIEDVLRNRVGDAFSVEAGTQTQREVRKQLAAFTDEIQTEVVDLFSKFAPDVKPKLQELSTNFKKEITKLLPEDIDEAIIRAESKKNYEDIGQTLGILSGVDATDSITKAAQYLNSIKTAYRATDSKGKQLLNLENLPTYDSALQYIREGYIANKISPILEANSVQEMKSLLNGFDNAEKIGHAKVILGDKTYAHMKNLINAVKDASFKQRSGILSLAFKSREFSAAAGLLALNVPSINLIGSATFLGLPYVLGKVINNPKAINKLLTLNKQVEKNPSKYRNAPELLSSSILKVMEELDDRQKVDIHQYMISN